MREPVHLTAHQAAIALVLEVRPAEPIAATLRIEVIDASEVFVAGTLSPQLHELLFGVDAAGRKTMAEPLGELVESVSVLGR